MQITQHMENRHRKNQLMLYWLGLMTVLLLLVTATYTWFSLSKTPRVSDMEMYVNSPAGLEIALRADSEEWGQELRFSDMVAQTSPLKPCTWSEENGRFYGAAFGVDGRLTGQWTPLRDETAADAAGSNGYYTKGTFYARSDSPVTVSLSDAVTVENGRQGAGTYLIGTPIWDGQTLRHEDGGSGAEDAIRIGLRITPLQDGNELPQQSTFYIYEPNCDRHTDGSTGYVETASIDSTPSLVPQERLITQTASDWTEVNPVQKTAVLHAMGQFTSNKDLFTLKADALVRIDLYIWLEGQDVDCTNLIGHEAQIFASLQFAADYSGQSGMTPLH